MSTSTASAPDTDSSNVPSLQEKRPPSASASPQSDNRPHPDDPPSWNFDDKQLVDYSALDNTPKVQLSSIFTNFEDLSETISIAPLSPASPQIHHPIPNTGPTNNPPAADLTHLLINPIPLHMTSRPPLIPKTNLQTNRLNYNCSESSSYPQPLTSGCARFHVSDVFFRLFPLP